MFNLRTKIRKIKPDVKESTIRTYLSNARRLQREVLGLKTNAAVLDLKWADRAALKYLKSVDNANMFSTFLILLKIKDSALYPEALQYYKDLMDRKNSRTAENVLSEKQQARYVSFERLVELKHELERDLGLKKLLRTTRISKHRMDELSFIMYLKFVLEMPPLRNEYFSMTIARKIPETGNAVVRSNNTWSIVMNDYKTSRTHGRYKEEIPRELGKVLTKFVKRLKDVDGRTYLFQKPSGQPYSKSGFVKWLRRNFREHLGKDVSISLIRKAYVSHRFPADSSLKERREVARKMGHSVKEQLSTYTVRRSKSQ